MKLSSITVDDAGTLLKDERKFSSFVRKNSNYINKIVHRYVGKNRLNGNDSEVFHDAYQEAVLSLWSKALPKYNGKTRFSTFAYTVVKNDILRFLQDRTKFESKNGEVFSIFSPSMTRSFEGTESQEFKENIWKVDPRKRSFEDSLIDEIMNEQNAKKLDRKDKIILELKKRNYSRDDIAQALGMNIHSYKAYYYGSFQPKMKSMNISS